MMFMNCEGSKKEEGRLGPHGHVATAAAAAVAAVWDPSRGSHISITSFKVSNKMSQGWGDGSVFKALAAQVRGPEF